MFRSSAVDLLFEQICVCEGVLPPCAADFPFAFEAFAAELSAAHSAFPVSILVEACERSSGVAFDFASRSADATQRRVKVFVGALARCVDWRFGEALVTSAGRPRRRLRALVENARGVGPFTLTLAQGGELAADGGELSVEVLVGTTGAGLRVLFLEAKFLLATLGFPVDVLTMASRPNVDVLQRLDQIGVAKVEASFDVLFSIRKAPFSSPALSVNFRIKRKRWRLG